MAKRPRAAAEDDIFAALPSDALLALRSLRRFFSPQPGWGCPAVPLPALASWCANSSALSLRSELQALSEEGLAREVCLGDGEAAVLTADLLAWARSAREGAPAGDARALEFFEFLCGAHAGACVSEGDLARIFRAWLRSGGGGGGGGAAAAAAAAATATPFLPTLRALQGYGLLARRLDAGGGAGGSAAYLFGAPHAGGWVRALRDGRAAVLARLRRAPGGQLPRKAVVEKGLPKAIPLHPQVIVHDLLGRRLLAARSSPAGEILTVL